MDVRPLNSSAGRVVSWLSVSSLRGQGDQGKGIDRHAGVGGGAGRVQAIINTTDYCSSCNQNENRGTTLAEHRAIPAWTNSANRDTFPGQNKLKPLASCASWWPTRVHPELAILAMRSALDQLKRYPGYTNIYRHRQCMVCSAASEQWQATVRSSLPSIHQHKPCVLSDSQLSQERRAFEEAARQRGNGVVS